MRDTPQTSPEQDTVYVSYRRITVDDLLLARPATQLFQTSNAADKRRKSVKTVKTTLRGREDNLDVARRRRSSCFNTSPRPTLPATPPSTETLAPGAHLAVDSKQWKTRGSHDAQFIRQVAAYDIETFHPTDLTFAPRLLALADAAEVCEKLYGKQRVHAALKRKGRGKGQARLHCLPPTKPLWGKSRIPRSRTRRDSSPSTSGDSTRA